MAVNKYKATCDECGSMVPANGGTLERGIGRRWNVYHLTCRDGEASVMTIRTSGGTFIRNSRGRCEDSPCCGCCTI